MWRGKKTREKKGKKKGKKGEEDNKRMRERRIVGAKL